MKIRLVSRLLPGIEPLRRKPWSILLVVLIFTALSVIPATALGPPAAQDQQPNLAPGPISTLPENQLVPEVAYASQVDQYLVVWEDEYSTSDHDIYAIPVNSSGVPVGGEKPIAASLTMETNPGVAYSPATNQYLVVWENEYQITDHDILGQLVAYDGSLVGGQINIAYTTAYDMKPLVTYNLTMHEFLVVFERKIGSDEFAQQDVYAQRVSEGGYNVGNEIVIANSLYHDRNPSAACDGTNYLVVWQGNTPTGYDIYGQRVSSDGYLIGAQIAISTWEGDQVSPVVAYNDFDYQYLVAWEDHHFSPSEIYAYRLDIFGGLIGSQIGVALGGANNRSDPEVTYLPAIHSYQVEWQYEYSISDHDIYSRRIAYDGSHPDPEYAISATGYEEKLPTAASNGSSSQLVVWADWRNYGYSGVDIYGSVEIISVPELSGGVYLGNVGDFSTPFPNVVVQLGCSSNQGVFGDLINTAITDSQGQYSMQAIPQCEYYNIVELDPGNYYSIGAQTVGGVVYSANWIYYTPSLQGKVWSGNYYWDQYQGGGDTTPPGNWANFVPAGWVNTQTVAASEQVEDTWSGLDVSTAEFRFSIDGGASWTGWQPASCTGYDGITTPQIISAVVPFGRDSGPQSQNMVQFRIADMAGNLGEGPAHAVNVDSVLPQNPTNISSSTHIVNVWSNNPYISLEWSGASDDRSGIYGYSTYYDQNPGTIPDIYRDTEPPNITIYAYFDSNNWWFHTRTLDNAGNAANGALHYGPFLIDTTAPLAWMTLPGGPVNNASLTVTWAGGDAMSGVDNYDVQTSINGGVWTDWLVHTDKTSEPFAGNNGEDVSFRVRANDLAGNTSAWSTPVLVHFGVDVTVQVAIEGGQNVVGAKVYHNAKYVGTTDGNGRMTCTDTLLGDQLASTDLIATAAAVKPDHQKDGTISWAWRVYLTSIDIPDSGNPVLFTVTDTNITQQLTLRKDQPLIGFHIIAVVQWDASSAFLDDVRQGMVNASNFLYDVSDGQMFFETIEIFDNLEMGPANDYIIYTDNQVWPNAFVKAITAKTGRMMFPPQFGTSWSSRMTYGTLIHEFGHYGLWLFDEYLERDGSNGGTCTLSRATVPGGEPNRASIMDNSDDASELCADFDTVHAHSYWTAQDKENNGESTWQTVMRVYSDGANPKRWILQSPDTRQVNVVTGPNAFPLTDMMKVYVDDNITNACAPFIQGVNNLDGTPAPGVGVSVISGPNSVLYQGLTDANGLITVRGAHNGETLEAKKGDASITKIISCSPSLQGTQPPERVSDIVLQPDPFTLAGNYLPISAGVVEVQVAASVALPAAPQASLFQDAAVSPIPVILVYDSGKGMYVGQASLDTNLDQRGLIHVSAVDAQAHTVTRMVAFLLQAIDPNGTTWLKSDDGRMEIFIQAGSLPGNPLVTIQPDPSVSPGQGEMAMVGIAYKVVTSNGQTQLLQPATLNIYYAPEQLPLLSSGVIGLYRWDEAGQTWHLVSTDQDIEHHMLSGHITELGTFAVLSPPMILFQLPLIFR